MINSKTTRYINLLEKYMIAYVTIGYLGMILLHHLFTSRWRIMVIEKYMTNHFINYSFLLIIVMMITLLILTVPMTINKKSFLNKFIELKPKHANMVANYHLQWSMAFFVTQFINHFLKGYLGHLVPYLILYGITLTIALGIRSLYLMIRMLVIDIEVYIKRKKVR